MDKARDGMVDEAKRYNEAERFHKIEGENNKQLHVRINHAKHDLAADKQTLEGVEQQCNELVTEVATLQAYRV